MSAAGKSKNIDHRVRRQRPLQHRQPPHDGGQRRHRPLRLAEKPAVPRISDLGDLTSDPLGKLSWT